MPVDKGARPAAAVEQRSWMTLRLAVVLLGLQFVGLVAVTVWLAVSDTSAQAHSAMSATALTFFVAVFAILFAALAVALTRLQVWARGPAIVLELLLVPIGYSMATSGLGLYGVLVLALGLAGAGLLLAPSTRAALGIR